MNEALQRMREGFDNYLETAKPSDVNVDLRPLLVRMMVICIISDIISRPTDLSYLLL